MQRDDKMKLVGYCLQQSGFVDIRFHDQSPEGADPPDYDGKQVAADALLSLRPGFKELWSPGDIVPASLKDPRIQTSMVSVADNLTLEVDICEMAMRVRACTGFRAQFFLALPAVMLADLGFTAWASICGATATVLALRVCRPIGWMNCGGRGR